MPMVEKFENNETVFRHAVENGFWRPAEWAGRISFGGLVRHRTPLRTLTARFANT